MPGQTTTSEVTTSTTESTTTETSTETTESTTESTTTETNTYLRPSDQLKTNEQGGRYAVDENGEVLTGYFTLEPNFKMGDATGDDSINAEDAALLLIAAAAQGSTGEPAEQYLFDNDKVFYDSTAKAKAFGDADENGEINASDAALLLIYAAAVGADPTTPALGYGAYVADAQGIIQTGIYKDETTGKTYYAGEDGILYTGWQTIPTADGEAAVYFDAGGQMAVNQWITDQTGRTIWVKEDGTKLVNSFLDTEDGKVYLEADGSRAVGIREVQGLGYYFNADGIMQKGLLILGDITCYADENGVLTTGLEIIDNVTYYFEPETYGMVTDQWLTLEDGTRYFGAAGAMLCDWQVIGADTYYFGKDGIKRTGMTEIEGKTYFLDENGVRRAGWREADGKRYYFFPVGCHMATGWQTIDNIRYYFYEDGTMASDTEIDGQKIQANGYAMSDMLCEATVKIQTGLRDFGTTPDEIFDYMRSTNRYKKTEATKTLDQLNEIGWTYLVNYACSNYYTVCYYMAAKMDYILKLSGYTSRIIYATHGTGDHYWNQVLIGEEWINYDPTNNLKAYTWDEIVAYGSYIFLDYVEPKYV